MAFKRLKRDYPDFDFECVAWSEIAKNACIAHDAAHPECEGRNLGDMTTCDYSGIETPIDVLFYSTPCQSVSTAGKQKGMKKGDDAASALIWHTERAIKELKPRYCILENVKGMVNKRNRPDFDAWCAVLESYGYKNFWQIMNSKNYGVPQNRERVFMVSILDPMGNFKFPDPFPLERKLRDVLEDEVDEKYYLSDDRVQKIISHCDRKQAEGCGFKPDFNEGGYK
ncbi:MAG: DNA cytosine methyltransferase [Lachnospiraceae bacterium]|nr:DNA cytosine methyltransferase [Lachnospiraceae bacterium]